MSASDAKDRLRLWLKMLKASRTIEGELRERLRTEFATTLPRFDVMAALDRSARGLKMSEISGLLRVSNGNVTGIVDRLVEEGLVDRRAMPGDRRAFLVALTARGRAAFAEQAAAHGRWIDTMLGGFDGAAAQAFWGHLDRLEAGLRPAPAQEEV